MRPSTLVALVALGGAFAWLTQPTAMARLAGMDSGRAANGEAESAEPARPDAIDPAPYREAIEAIEQVLYQEAPASWGDPETVSSRAMQLGDRIYADLGPLRGRKPMTDLVDFATSVGAQSESGFAAPELDAPRAAWEALRAQWFRRAPWFRRTTARLVAAQRLAAPTASLVDLHELWKWAGAIESFADGGRPALERYGEVMVDAAEGSQDERDLIGRWSDFARDWDARVRGLGAQAPRRPAPNGEPNLLFAHQALEQALQQLALATTAEGDAAVPMKWWRTQCLDAAAAHLEAARKFLTQARTGAKPHAESIPAAMPAP